jgi:hypothetical protein
MVPYAPAAYRPAVASPAAIRRYGHTLGLTFDAMFGWSPTVGDMLRLGFHGASAYVGFYLWTTDRGFIKWFGLVFAVGQSVGAICDVVSLVQRATGTHPSEGAGA